MFAMVKIKSETHGVLCEESRYTGFVRLEYLFGKEGVSASVHYSLAGIESIRECSYADAVHMNTVALRFRPYATLVEDVFGGIEHNKPSRYLFLACTATGTVATVRGDHGIIAKERFALRFAKTPFRMKTIGVSDLPSNYEKILQTADAQDQHAIHLAMFSDLELDGLGIHTLFVEQEEFALVSVDRCVDGAREASALQTQASQKIANQRTSGEAVWPPSKTRVVDSLVEKVFADGLSRALVLTESELEELRNENDRRKSSGKS